MLQPTRHERHTKDPKIVLDNQIAAEVVKLHETQVSECVNRLHGEVNFYLPHILSDHGYFRHYLHK